MSIPDDLRPDVLRVTKYMTPASDNPSLLQTTYTNVNLFDQHLFFLIETFPERFAGMTNFEYHQLVGIRATRTYFSGILYSFESLDG